MTDRALGIKILLRLELVQLLVVALLQVQVDLSTWVVQDVLIAASLRGLIPPMPGISHVLDASGQYMDIFDLFEWLRQQVTGVGWDLDRHLTVWIVATVMTRRFPVPRCRQRCEQVRVI